MGICNSKFQFVRTYQGTRTAIICGGEYVTITGNVRRVDDHNREILFTDGMTVGIDDVWNIRIIQN